MHRFLTFLILLLLSILVTFHFSAFAQETISDLKNKINSSQSEIEKIEQEIRKYEKELQAVSRKKKTLKNALYEIQLSQKKLANQIYLTEKKIKKLEEQILELQGGVKQKEKKIKENKQVLARMLRLAGIYEDRTLAEILLSNNFADILHEMENIKRLQELIAKQNDELRQKKLELQNTAKNLEESKKDLARERSKLQTQKRSLDIAVREQKKLLSATQNKESNYQKILAAKRKAKEEFENQMRELESKLKYILNPDKLPQKGSKVFRWPLDKVWITQYFGNTKFAKSGAYNGKGHNGIDLGAVIGTPVKAVLSGTVVETGNTDAYPGCYSYGKWVLIKHGNGLSTLYAHLSDIRVKAGQKVITGQVIAYSGNTGYSTGPHLHFTVYASDAVKVVPLGSWRKTYYCAKARVPVAPLNAYMNPLDYLR